MAGGTVRGRLRRGEGAWLRVAVWIRVRWGGRRVDESCVEPQHSKGGEA